MQGRWLEVGPVLGGSDPPAGRLLELNQAARTAADGM